MRFGTALEFTLPDERSNFRHLVGDIAWYGVALAATTRFLSVYAIRVGATPMDLGLISSLPPLVILFSSMFGAWWMRRYTDSARALFWPGLGMRLPFLLPAFAPLLPMEWRPFWLVLTVTIPAIPQGISGVVFTVMLRQGIRDHHITPLLSQRSVALNVTIGAAALAFGVWLEAVPYPFNYQAMFVVAFAFSLVSSWHCLKIRALAPIPADIVEPEPPSVSPWRSPRFVTVVVVILLTHIAFTSITSITPIRLVDDLGANEGFMALSALSELAAGALVALFADQLVRRFGNRALIAVSLVITALGALVLALATSLPLTLLGTALSGGAWTSAGIGVFGFFMENTPQGDLTSYSTAFQQAIGLALFIGPMLGSGLVQSGAPVVQVLLLGAALRLIAGALTEFGSVGRWRRLPRLRFGRLAYRSTK